MNKIYLILIAVVSIVIVMITLPALSSQVDDLTGKTPVTVDYDFYERTANDKFSMIFYSNAVTDYSQYNQLDFEIIEEKQDAFIYIPNNPDMYTLDSSVHDIIVHSTVSEGGSKTYTLPFNMAIDNEILDTFSGDIRIDIYKLIEFVVSQTAEYDSYDVFYNVEWLTIYINLDVTFDATNTEEWNTYYTTTSWVDTTNNYEGEGAQIKFNEYAIYEGTTTGVLINILPTVIIAGVVIATVALVYIKKRG